MTAPRNRRQSFAPPALTVVVHRIEHARAACRAARDTGAALEIRSAPGAASFMGPAWFLAMARRVATEYPDVPAGWVLDCGDAAGQALAALRQGVPAIRFTGRGRVREKLAAIAESYGAVLAAPAHRPLDLARATDPEAACRARLPGRK